MSECIFIPCLHSLSDCGTRWTRKSSPSNLDDTHGGLRAAGPLDDGGLGVFAAGVSSFPMPLHKQRASATQQHTTSHEQEKQSKKQFKSSSEHQQQQILFRLLTISEDCAGRG